MLGNAKTMQLADALQAITDRNTENFQRAFRKTY